ncbi:histidine phosphatase family protein [Frondihabitans australicus]|uniref:phosphoglycerate mutase (2,3-diphosphoglycerate-dependent) n=1 Tax=Frondihabitans australicus TaxID=386892 RepID=A0A495IFS8_9MICO|nr:histidine phosphatase family protein [Frondihabitans australicus]RKR74268.1 2,3-bisphosphoglycerate-dependent phosphoglycerate mutase [Frondihabitans australicus]
MPIYFIRHGESSANERNRFAGHLESHLTPLGESQARDAGKRALDLGLEVDEVHISTLSRTRRTAELALGEMGQSPVVVESGLIVERHFGVYGGKNKSLVKKAVGFATYTEHFHSNAGAPPGGETWAELYGRAKAYYDEVLTPADRAGRTVLVVTHKYVVEMFALIAAGIDPSEYRDLKVPNARPLSVDDLRRIARADSTTAAVNDLGEIVEIRFPLLAFVAALVGVGLHIALPVTVPTIVFEVGLGALLAVTSFFSLLRIAPSILGDPALRPSRRSVLAVVPLVVLKAGLALILLQLSDSPLALLGALLLLLPPALLAPTLSLAWGGDYFAAICQTVVATLVLPAVVGVVVLLDSGSSFDAARLPEAALAFALVVVGSFVLPLVAAQAFRRRSPIRAGQVSTNWNWLGSVAVIVLALFAGYSLTPSDLTVDASVAGQIGFAVAALLAIRLLAGGYLKVVRPDEGVDRDIRITQATPNVFLWVSLSAALFGAREAGFGTAAVVTFFGLVWLDDVVRVRRQRRELADDVAALGRDPRRDLEGAALR